MYNLPNNNNSSNIILDEFINSLEYIKNLHNNQLQNNHQHQNNRLHNYSPKYGCLNVNLPKPTYRQWNELTLKK